MRKEHEKSNIKSPRRICLIVAYDGTNYHGFQMQNNAASIMALLEGAVQKATGEKNHLMGASRTDAGVHALGNVAVFDTASSIPASKFLFAVNAHLPKDIVVVDSYEVAGHFHPRHQNTIKTYGYSIYNARTRNPIKDRTSTWVPTPLNVAHMKEASLHLIGTHDFISFSSVGSSAVDTVRTIYRLEWKKEGEDIAFTVSGSGFLYHMVRLMAGVFLRVGKGALPPEAVKEILEKRQIAAAHPTAPARGLILLKVEYPDAKKPPLVCGEDNAL